MFYLSMEFPPPFSLSVSSSFSFSSIATISLCNRRITRAYIIIPRYHNSPKYLHYITRQIIKPSRAAAITFTHAPRVATEKSSAARALLRLKRTRLKDRKKGRGISRITYYVYISRMLTILHWIYIRYERKKVYIYITW